MNGPRHLRARIWMPVAIVTLIAGHGIILYYVSSHLALSAAAVAVLIVLVVIKHLGWLAPSTLFSSVVLDN
jgi:hypothetical protein